MPDPAFLIGGICEGRRVPAVTIFGWDDVLCPTTHAKRQEEEEEVDCRRRDVRTSKLERKELLQLGQSVVRLVRAAQRHGPVVIVTQSREQWVRGTAELLLPGGAATACLDNVEIVSSSDRFGRDFPNQPACWQIAALSYVTNRYLLSRGALARIRVVDAAADAAGARDVAGSADDGGGDGPPREAGNDAAAAGSETGTSSEGEEDSGNNSRPPQGEGSRRGNLVRSGSSSGKSGGGDGGTGGMRPRGTLIAVATASRASENKSAALTLREHHPDVVTKTVSLAEAPTPSELRNQLELLADNFELMFGHCLPPRGPQSPAPVPGAVPAPPVLARVLEPPASPTKALVPALPATPPAPVPPAPREPSATASAPPTPSPALSASPAPSPAPSPSPSPPPPPVIRKVPSIKLPLKLRRLEEGEEEEARSRRAQPGPSRYSSVAARRVQPGQPPHYTSVGDGDPLKIDYDDDGDDDDDYAGDSDDCIAHGSSGRDRCGSFWASTSSCTSSPASSATTRSPLAGIDLPPSNGAAAGGFGFAAHTGVVAAGGTPPAKHPKENKLLLSRWSSDSVDDDDDHDDDDEYLTAVCSASTMSSNVSSLAGEGEGGLLPFATGGPDLLLSPPHGWASATSAPPNPPPRLHRRRSKPPAVAVE